MDIILTNARSIELKIDSLCDQIVAYNAAVVLITESWLKTSRNFDRVKERLELDKGLKIHAYNRPGKRAGGGVCIVSDPRKIKLEENKFKRRSYEICSVKGNLVGLNRNIVLYVVYLPPNLGNNKAEEACLLINDDITRINVELNDPLVIIAGDVNQNGISKCVVDHLSYSIVTPLETRGKSRIDQVACNCIDYIVENETIPPLESITCESDHRGVWCKVSK